ncbi:MAG TPA: arylesterase [Rhizobiaceae bacterium]|nr:arylesterase [Rhizobiaceae bacterium]
MAFNRILGAAFVALSFLFGAPLAHAAPIQIVAFGDSLTAGFGLDPGQAFPEKLQAALVTKGHDVVVANAGVSGDTSSGGLSRLDWSVPDGTQLVILELGANDMLRGITPDVTENNLDAIIARLKERNIPVLLAGMLAAPNLGPDYAEAFNGIYPKLAEKHGIPLYPFFLQGVAADKQFLLEDGMHPNAEGVDLMVEGILPAVEQALATISGDS